jgi:hypothetical protein
MGWGDEMEQYDTLIKTSKPILESCLDTEDFPSLSDFKEVSRKKRVHNSTDKHEVKTEVKTENVKTVKTEKTIICKSIKEGKDCSYGNKCIYAHYLEDLTPKKCGFGDRCFRVKYNTKNVVRNVDNKNSCVFIHPQETVDMFAKRQGAKTELMKKPDPSIVYKNTRMCQSILEGKSCESPDECTYAHVFEDLRIQPCIFGNDCNHVTRNNNDYVNNKDSIKKCFYIHPEENKMNYKKRVIDTYVHVIKRKSELPIEYIDTSIKKKQKIE